jgi:sugar phosphate isomerase/epimerase
MKFLSLLGLVLLVGGPARAVSDPLFAPENLLAWCIVPYDSVHRTPEQRVEMLRELGFTQYIWDWRAEHIKDLPAEIAAAIDHGIRLRGVWLWMDERTDRVGQLNEPNRVIVDTMRATGEPVEYWVGFNANYFAGLDDAAAVAKGTAMVSYLREQVGPQGTVCLYNHGDWFGEPDNQIKIIRAAGPERLGLVYNLHHAEGQIAHFGELLPRMLPFLKAVNLNGVNPGAKDSDIVTLGEGQLERALIRQLQASGYRGPLGILGHTQDEDVAVVLRRNLDGLHRIAAGQ